MARKKRTRLGVRITELHRYRLQRRWDNKDLETKAQLQSDVTAYSTGQQPVNRQAELADSILGGISNVGGAIGNIFGKGGQPVYQTQPIQQRTAIDKIMDNPIMLFALLIFGFLIFKPKQTR